MQKIDREYFINQIDQFSIEHDLIKEDEMNYKLEGWGDSMVSTKYIYQRINAMLDMSEDDISYHLSRLSDELSLNYKADTGKRIGEVL
jgi:hypothetical protein